jgi:hypothetical protein
MSCKTNKKIDLSNVSGAFILISLAVFFIGFVSWLAYKDITKYHEIDRTHDRIFLPDTDNKGELVTTFINQGWEYYGNHKGRIVLVKEKEESK